MYIYCKRWKRVEYRWRSLNDATLTLILGISENNVMKLKREYTR